MQDKSLSDNYYEARFSHIITVIAVVLTVYFDVMDRKFKGTEELKELSPVENIESKVLTIRGLKVILDRGLAALCGVETKVFNQAVKRNWIGFQKTLCFALVRLKKSNWS